MGIIYCARNILNNKIYIGKTKHSLEWRKRKHWECRNDPYAFHKAVLKYGISGFSWTVLDRGEDETSLALLEQEYIDMFSSCCNGVGYNLTHGGEGMSANDATLRKLRKPRREGWVNPTIGRKHTEAAIERMRKGKAENKFVYTPELRKKMSDLAKGRPNGRKGKTFAPPTTFEEAANARICVMCGELFPSREANRDYCTPCKSKYNSRELKRKRKELMGESPVPKGFAGYFKEHPVGRCINRATSYRLRCRKCGILFVWTNCSRRYCDECKKEAVQ